MQRISQNDAGVMVRTDRQGKLQIKLQSAVLTGRATVYTLHDAARQSDNQRRRSVAKCAALLAVRQNELWGDNHDPEEVMRKADEALHKFMTTNRPVAAIGLFTTFEPNNANGPGKKTKDIASRSSDADPFTRDFLKGKTWE